MRTKPYTEIGIRRVKCFRCGNKASQQWGVCALGNKWIPICNECDVSLNYIVLEFMKVPKIHTIMTQYMKKRLDGNPE